MYKTIKQWHKSQTPGFVQLQLNQCHLFKWKLKLPHQSAYQSSAIAITKSPNQPEKDNTKTMRH